MGLSFWLFLSMIIVIIAAIIFLAGINLRVKKIKKEVLENKEEDAPDLSDKNDESK